MIVPMQILYLFVLFFLFYFRDRRWFLEPVQFFKNPFQMLLILFVLFLFNLSCKSLTYWYLLASPLGRIPWRTDRRYNVNIDKSSWRDSLNNIQPFGYFNIDLLKNLLLLENVLLFQIISFICQNRKHLSFT